MRRLPRQTYGAAVALLVFLTLAADSGVRAQSASPTSPSNPGLVLQKDEGELRVRRPRRGTTVELPTFIIKVDRQYGKSSSFFMVMEDIPPGQGIRRHRHPHAEEILFIHRGTGVARLGEREAQVTTGATIWIPRDVKVELRNTGQEPLTLLAFFPEADGMSSYMRAGSVPEGQEAKPFTPEELKRHYENGRAHIIFDELPPTK